MKNINELITDEVYSAIDEWTEFVGKVNKDITTAEVNVMTARLQTEDYLKQKDAVNEAFHKFKDALYALSFEMGKSISLIDNPIKR